VTSRKMAKMDLETKDGNCTLHLKELKIKDYKNSAPGDESQLISSIKDSGENMNDEILAKTDSKDVVKLMHTVSVTYYKLKLFKEAFIELDISQIHRSLSPKNNRETVFKAGEGSGRSGSFFFFSHDKRFIIKTMST
jgi:Icc-related predicted phosphoesterase